MKRLLTALALAPLVWALLRYAPMWAFVVVVVLVLSAGVLESYGVLAARGTQPLRAVGLLTSWGVAASFIDLGRFDIPLALPLALGTMVSLLGAMWTRQDPPEMFDAVLATLFPVLFVGLTLAHLLALRFVDDAIGRELVFLLCLCVMLGDTAAYYVGSALGRRRLAPRLSPKKSLEGALAAVVASVGAACLARAWFWSELPLAHALILGALLGAAGIFGDLAESLFKRAAGVKDTSTLLPGHGGFLDRTDSLLFATPVLYYYYRAFLDGLV